MFQDMLDAIRVSLSNLTCSYNAEDGEDDEDTEQGKLSKEDKPGWVMGTMLKTVQQRMQRYRQNQIKLDELTQPGWGDVADYFGGRENKYGRTELQVPAVVKLHKDDN